MVGYINSVRDKEYKLCTPEIFEQLLNSPMVQTNVEECRKGAQTKQLLPAFIFQGYDPNVLLGKTGSRLAKALKPTGFFIMDFDHIESPHKVYDKFLQKLPSLGFDLKRDVALAHVTPSGKGLRLVLVTPNGMTIEAAQAWVAKGMKMEVDRVVKDLSRLSFCPMASDILYINKVLLFGNVNAMAEYPVRDNLCVAQGFNPGSMTNDGNQPPCGVTSVTEGQMPDTMPVDYRGNSDGVGVSSADVIPGVEPPRYTERMPTASADAQHDTSTCVAQQDTSPFPSHYNGIPYKRIVEELILLHGGEPQVGNRENTVFRLASDLAKITDRSAPWLESLIPTFGLPEEEWRATIAQVCKKPMETGMSRLLQDAISRCRQEVKAAEIEHGREDADGQPPRMPDKLPSLIELLTSKVMDFQKPAVATMVFPALATYVNDATFKMADNTDVELGLMSVLVGKQSVGKSCINQPIKQILSRIETQDNINYERLRQWQEKQRNKKNSERGESMPLCPIRILDSDTSSAAFLLRLEAAEKGDDKRPNLCTYTHVDEIEELYRFCMQGGKMGVRAAIKNSWDRRRTGANRATINAVNAKTILRWNWTASTTIDAAKKFFKSCLTDGTTSRVDFCTIIPPLRRINFRYGDYDRDFEKRLRPYIDNLENFKCERTDDNRIIPARFAEVAALEGRLLDYMQDNADAEPDDTYANYGKRAVVMTVKKILILYLANGCRWEREFEAFAWWSYNYAMWCKMNLFYTQAREIFEEERIESNGHKSPLKMMPREFTLADFSALCKKLNIKTLPLRILSLYKTRGLITQSGDTYTIGDEFCRKYFIK